MIKNKYRILLALSLMLCFFSSAYTQTDNLTLKWGDGSGFTDVDALLPTHNAASWDITTDTRQIQIAASFANVGTSGGRMISVIIPRGFKILAYSAKSGTVPPAGVSAIDLALEVDAKLNSSVLTALDNLDFASQRINGYTGTNTFGNTPYYNMDGMVVYDCTPQCDNITLTLKLSLDPKFFPYNATSTVLPENIKVSTSNATSGINLSKELTVTATGLVVPTLMAPSTGVVDNGNTRQVAGIVNSSDPTGNTGTIPAFMTGIVYSDYNSVFGSMIHFADKVTFTTSYPSGVTYQGFDMGQMSGNARWFTLGYTAAPAGGAFAGGHLNVAVDAVNRKLTYTFTNVFIPAAIGTFSLIRSYWTGNVDNDVITWGKQLSFTTTLSEIGGSIINNQQSLPTTPSNQVIVTPVKPQISLTLGARNYTMRDLNAYADSVSGANFPYDYALGNFSLNNAGPTPPENITYNFTFPESPQIRGVNLPAGASADATNIVATGMTNLGNSINYSGTRPLVNNAFILTPDILGLRDGEYLTSLSVKQKTLAIMNFGNVYTYSAITYFGKWVNGKGGAVQLSITDENGNQLAPLPPLPPITDNTQIGWTRSGAGSFTTVVVTPSGNPVNTFYPGQSIVCTSTYSQLGTSIAAGQSNTVDPDIYINLPAGISLDVNSLSVQSVAGKNGSSSFQLNLFETITKVIAGVEWTSYHFRVKNPLDIIVLSTNQSNIVSGGNNFVLNYTVTVSSACNAYATLPANQICQIDLGQTAVAAISSGIDYTTADTYNWTGKGTSYKVVGASQSPSISVVKKPGLQVYLGIRTHGTTQNYFTYNGTDASIAAVSPTATAEVWIKYENTSDAPYFENSEIYLPVPKNNITYTHYFNNSDFSNPAELEDSQTANRAPQWTAELAGEVTLPGFNTMYSADVSQETNYQTTGINASWKPVTMTWLDYAGLLAAGKKLSDVTMIKLTASANIPSAGNTGCIGETTFNLEMADDTQIGKYNYWRSYQKGWLDDAGAGTWVYGSVIAATPAADAIIGMIFKDVNRNGVLDSGEEYSASNPLPAGFTATIAGPGISGLLTMKISVDGSFKSLNSDGSIRYLGAGTYTVTINNVNPELYHFDLVNPDTRSYFDTSGKPVWMNDIQRDFIRTDNSSATYTFTVDTSNNAMPLVGVGLKDTPKFIPVNPQIRKGIE